MPPRGVAPIFPKWERVAWRKLERLSAALSLPLGDPTSNGQASRARFFGRQATPWEFPMLLYGLVPDLEIRSSKATVRTTPNRSLSSMLPDAYRLPVEDYRGMSNCRR